MYTQAHLKYTQAINGFELWRYLKWHEAREAKKKIFKLFTKI